MEEELITLGIIDKSKLDRLKRKKRKSDRQIFEERIRCDLETINKVILVGKLYKSKERKKEEKERNYLDESIFLKNNEDDIFGFDKELEMPESKFSISAIIANIIITVKKVLNLK